MDALVESLSRLRIHSDAVPVPTVSKRQLIGAVQHLYIENMKLKKEIKRLKRLQNDISISEPNIPHWVS